MNRWPQRGATLSQLKGIGANDATLLANEVFYRDFRNLRELAGLGWDRTDPPCKRRYGTGSGDRRRWPRMDPREPDPDGLALGSLSA